MPNNYTYTLSLIDKMSAPLRQVSGASTHVSEKLDHLIGTQNKFQATNQVLGGSIASLRAKLDMLRNEREIISPANIKDVRTYNVEIEKLEKQIKKLDNAGTNNSFRNLNIVAGIQQVQALSDSMANMSAPGVGFNQSMADLSSITGITGNELKQLGEVARKTGADSGMGAAQGAKAFEFLASQIDVSKIGLEGLKELQTKTITLAQASGMTMGDSAMALAGTINQFGLSADQADRIINVLAAGSKYGAAEISDLSQSFKVVGAAANAAGLSVEGTAGAIEVLSKNNLKGAEAGTALRNIILKMQTELGVDFSKTSLGDALDTLKPKLKDATYLSKLFGMENIAAAQFMIGNTDAIKEMTDRVTDTNVAQEQATIRTDTWQNKMEVARAKVDNLKISLFEGTNGWIGYFTIMSETLVPLAQMSPLFIFMGNMMTKVGLTAKLAAAGQWLLNTSLYSCPIVWIIAGVAALVAGIVLLWNKCEGFRKVVLGTWEVLKLFGSIIGDVILGSVKNLIGGLGSLGSALWKLFTGDFKGAAKEAKEGATKLFKASPIGMIMDVKAKVSEADFSGAYDKGAAKGIKAQPTDIKKQSALDKIAPSLGVAQSVTPNPVTNQPTTSIPQIIGDSTSGKVNLNNLKGTTNYSAITAQLAPVTIDSVPKLASPMGVPSVAVADNQQPQTFDSPTGQGENRKTRIEKICEVLNINIASANDKGYDQIKDEIIEQLQIALG